MPTKCIMWAAGKCDSAYGDYLKCDGINPPKNCPYKNKSKEEKQRGER